MRWVIDEYGKQVEITGYRSKEFAKVEAFLKTNRKNTASNVNIQLFDADLIATSEHLYFAALNALQAFKTKTNISKSIAVETILYASAKRQIQKAIETIGVNPKTKCLAVAIIGSNAEDLDSAQRELTAHLGIKPDESVLELTPEKQRKIRATFQIGDKEMKIATKTTPNQAIVDLVIEHVALLSAQI